MSIALLMFLVFIVVTLASPTGRPDKRAEPAPISPPVEGLLDGKMAWRSPAIT